MIHVHLLAEAGADSQFWMMVLDKFWQYGENIVLGIVILVAAWLLSSVAGSAFRKVLTKPGKLDQQVINLAVKGLKILIIVLAIIAVLARFGVQTTSIIALLGGMGLAVGLALQGMLSNVASGVMLMLLRPFTIGEVVKLNGDVFIIDDLGLFVTAAHQPDGPKVWMQNNKVWGTEIVNLSRMHDDVRRFDLVFGIAYGDSIDDAMAIIQELVDADERILDDPEQLIAVQTLNDSSVDILCRVWTKPADWWMTQLELRKAVKIAFDERGITIPFPQRELRMLSDEGHKVG